MIELSYQLPWPPTVNHIYARTKRGGVMLNPKAKAYREEVIGLVGKGHTAFAGGIAVRIEVYMPDRRKRDLDNLGKAVLDSLTHAGVWNDDSQIGCLLFIKRGIESPGRVIVTVKPHEMG